MNKFYKSLSVLRKLAEKKPISAMLEYAENNEFYGDFITELYACGAESALLNYVQRAIILDENSFSVTCAEGKTPSQYLTNAFERDVVTILKIVKGLPESNDYALGEQLDLFKKAQTEGIAKTFKALYSSCGYGQFIYGKAYKCTDGKIVTIDDSDDISLNQLKDYKEEKTAVINNVTDFLNGLPFAHMLLYGDRGTGKSSTVHAVLNEYASKGLRLIEISRNQLCYLLQIKQKIAKLPLKFIIFIDDLTFSESDESAAILRAAVEGSVAAGSNSMIVATSNRRHIIKDSVKEREDTVHASEYLEEQLSLSDRFGLTVMFSSTDKQHYLSIVNQLADDLKLKTPKAELEKLAEQWAVVNGGRSPRKAKQFTDFAYSCERSGRAIEF